MHPQGSAGHLWLYRSSGFGGRPRGQYSTVGRGAQIGLDATVGLWHIDVTVPRAGQEVRMRSLFVMVLVLLGAGCGEEVEPERICPSSWRGQATKTFEWNLQLNLQADPCRQFPGPDRVRLALSPNDGVLRTYSIQWGYKSGLMIDNDPPGMAEDGTSIFTVGFGFDPGAGGFATQSLFLDLHVGPEGQAISGAFTYSNDATVGQCDGVGGTVSRL